MRTNRTRTAVPSHLDTTARRAPSAPKSSSSWRVPSSEPSSSVDQQSIPAVREADAERATPENSSGVDLPCLPNNASMSAPGSEVVPAQGDSDMGNRNALAPRTELAAFANTRRELAALDAMTVGELAEKYREVFDVPTRTRNKDYLRRRIAFRIQELQEGGLSPRALDRIGQLAPQAPARWHEPAARTAAAGAPGRRGKPEPRDPRLPPAGYVLTRIHDGIEHRITILSDGFEYRGEHHRSLSQIAKLITGTRWNGYRFFFGNARGGRAGQQEGGE